jgi:hypothetical protein
MVATREQIAVEEGPLVFSYDARSGIWLCPYCGADANPGICSRCDKAPTLAQMFGEEPLAGAKKPGRPTCRHPLRQRSKTTGRCLECDRKRKRQRRKEQREAVSAKPLRSPRSEGVDLAPPVLGTGDPVPSLHEALKPDAA